MTSLECVLHGLKFMSKNSKFIVETKVPDFDRYVFKRDEYERYFRQCNGKAFLVEYMEDGIEEGKAAIFLACFSNAEDTAEYNRLCTSNEKDWSEEHDADTVVDNMMTAMAEE